MYAGAALCSKDNAAEALGESSLPGSLLSLFKPLLEQMPWPRQHWIVIKHIFKIKRYFFPRKETFQTEIQ